MSHLFHCHKKNSPWPQEAHGDLPEGLWVFLKFPPWFIVLTGVMRYLSLSGAFTAILLISRQKNNNPGPVISVSPLTVYSTLLLT